MMLMLLCTSAWAATVTDEITPTELNLSGNGYVSWTKTFPSGSGAVYAGNSYVSSDYIQIRSSESNSGIVTTTSGGKVKSVTITFNKTTASDKTVQIYGKNTAYESAVDLYSNDNSTKGTLLGTIHYQGNNDTEPKTLTVDGDYEYIGIRSAKNAIYIDKIQIEWEVPEASTEFGIKVTPTPAEGQVFTAPVNVTIELLNATGEEAYFDYYLDNVKQNNYPEGGFTLYKTTAVKVVATNDDEDLTEVTWEGTYTIELPALEFTMTPPPGTYQGEREVTIASNAVSDIIFDWTYTTTEDDVITGNQNNTTFTAAKSGVLRIFNVIEDNTDRGESFDQTYNYTITEPISLDGMIVFKDNDTDGSNDLTNNNFKNQITKGADCIESASFNKVYSGTSGLKFSTGSVGGTMTLNLANKWNATKISFIAKNWASSNGTFDQATMTVNDNSFALTNEFNLYEVTLTEPQQIEAITFVANKRAYLKVINIAGQEIILEKTATPEIVVTEGEEAYTVTATGAGTVKLYKNGEEVENPCTVARTSEEQTFVFTATAQEEGKDISDVATQNVTVPALPVVQSFGITVSPEAGTYTEPVTVTITATGLEEGQTATITYTLNGGDEQTYTEPFTLNETTAVSVRATFGDKVATWTGTYTINLPIENPTGLIVFKSNSTNNSSALDGEGLIDEIIDSDGKDYVLSAENIVKVYAGMNGLKFGTSSENGSMTLNLRGTWNANKISIIAKNYDDDAKFKVTVNGNSKEFNLSNDNAFHLYEFQLEQAQEVSAITFESTTRAYLKVINIEGEAPVIYRIKVDNAGGAYKGRADVKATLEPELEGAKLFYTFAEDGATETPAEQPYPEAGVTVLKSGKLTFIARNGETELARRWEGTYTITPLIGDVNGDGKVDVQDVNYVVNIILGKINPNE